MNFSGHEGDIPNQTTNTYVNPITKTEDQTPLLPNNNNNRNIVPFSKPVKYKECLKNHAASIGGNATDGCGEFMPNGEEGTLESFKCSACNCHRNFHRKELEEDELMAYHAYKSRFIAHPPTLVMPLGAIQASQSDEMEAGCFQNNVFSVKKRFRTKFSQEQKEKMLAFAEKVGWKLQRQEEGLVQEFCQEIGVKRRVLKVWMHNNKHTFARKNCIDAAAADGD